MMHLGQVNEQEDAYGEEAGEEENGESPRAGGHLQQYGELPEDCEDEVGDAEQGEEEVDDFLREPDQMQDDQPIQD